MGLSDANTLWSRELTPSPTYVGMPHAGDVDGEPHVMFVRCGAAIHQGRLPPGPRLARPPTQWLSVFGTPSTRAVASAPNPAVGDKKRDGRSDSCDLETHNPSEIGIAGIAALKPPPRTLITRNRQGSPQSQHAGNREYQDSSNEPEDPKPQAMAPRETRFRSCSVGAGESFCIRFGTTPIVAAAMRPSRAEGRCRE